jgi:uncharacterized protein (DUF2342 family)
MSSRPGDDELPPDPFPGDPFANAEPAGDGGPTPNAMPSGADGSFSGFDANAFGPMAGLFAQFTQAAAGQGTINTEIARHLAIWTAAGGTVEPNLDPMTRIGVERTASTVAPLVEEVTGLSLHAPGQKLVVTAATRAEWAADALVTMRPLLDGIATGITTMFAAQGDNDEGAEELAALGLGQIPGGLAGLAKMLGPTIAGTQAGSLLGQIGSTAAGTYDLLLPRTSDARILVVTANVTAFSEAWSLPADHALTHIVVRDLVTHGVLRLPVGATLRDLARDHAAAGRTDPQAMGGAMGGLAGMFGQGMFGQGMFGQGDGPTGPEDTFLTEPTPEQQRLRGRLQSILIPLVAAIDYLASVVGARLLGDNRQVVEADRRKRLDRDEGTKLAEGLLGIALDQAGLDLGRSFVGGVLQRGGHDGLLALFSDPEHLPTQAELSAPGLWLARIGLAD